MAALPQKIIARRRRRVLAPVLVLVGALTTGCVTTKSLVPHDKQAAPTGAACQVMAVWSNQVLFAPDPVNGGRPSPGLVGRVYLFGPQMSTPLAGDGDLVVDLYDLSPCGQGGNPIMLEEWRIDNDTLKRLLNRDEVGWGYTVFLPWGTYKPEINKVQLKLRYEAPLPPDQLPTLASLDKNGDNLLTREELAGTPYDAVFDHMDANRDGKIERKEFQPYVKKHLRGIPLYSQGSPMALNNAAELRGQFGGVASAGRTPAKPAGAAANRDSPGTVRPAAAFQPANDR